MYREVTMFEVTEALRLWLSGTPKKRIAAQLGLDPKTVRHYVTVGIGIAVCANLVDDPAYLASLQRRLLQGKLSPAIEQMLWYYAKGKPKERVDVGAEAAIFAMLDAARQRNAQRHTDVNAEAQRPL